MLTKVVVEFSSAIVGLLVDGYNSGNAESMLIGARTGRNAAKHNATFFVHGTNSSPEDADPEFITALEETFEEEVIQLDWTPAENNKEARTKAADKLNKQLSNYKYKEGEKLNLIAHSHGGNVIKEFTQKYTGDKKIDNLVFLGIPHRRDYKLDYSDLAKNANKINLYDRGDLVQKIGGTDYWKTNDFMKYDFKIYDYNPSRVINNFNNIEIYQTDRIKIHSYKEGYIDIQERSIGPIDSHILLDSAPIFNQYIRPYVKENNKN